MNARRIPVAALLLALIGTAGCAGPRATAPSSDQDSSEIALRRRAEAAAHFATAVSFALKDDPEQAATEFDLATRKDAGNEELILDVTRRLMLLRQLDRAREIAERATATPNPSAEVLGRLGFICSQMGMISNAISANCRALEIAPDSPGVRQNLFLNYVQTRQPAQALSVLDDWARLPNVSQEQRVDIAGMYGTYAQQFPTQRETAQERTLKVLSALNEERLTPQLRIRVAERYQLSGDITNSARLYLQVVDEFADAPSLREHVRGRLVELYLRVPDATNAQRQLELMAAENPANFQARYSLSGIASAQNDWTNAAAHLERVIALNAGFEQAYYDLATAQVAMDLPDAALATLDVARQLFRARFVSDYLEAMARSHKEQFALAVLAYESAERRAQDSEARRLNHVFYFQFAAACERAGDIPRAVKLFEKCLGMKPDNAEALNYLGFLWADRGENLERAKELIERALIQEPDNAAFLDSMGWVLFRLNQFEPALDYMLRAVKAETGQDPTVLDHLGDVFAALNRMEEARDAWKRSHALKADEKVRRKFEP
jgi:tetratricopeptide (TPR) repeat protein